MYVCILQGKKSPQKIPVAINGITGHLFQVLYIYIIECACVQKCTMCGLN
jgi:hypothetical protein